MAEVPLPISRSINSNVNIAEQSLNSVRVQESTPLTVEDRNYSSGVNSLTQDISGATTLDALVVPDGSQLLVKADGDNTDAVLLDGFPLEPGEAFPLPVNDASEISVDVSSGTQRIFAIAVSGGA
jgi:hypothetical protein